MVEKDHRYQYPPQRSKITKRKRWDTSVCLCMCKTALATDVTYKLCRHIEMFVCTVFLCKKNFRANTFNKQTALLFDCLNHVFWDTAYFINNPHFPPDLLSLAVLDGRIFKS